MGDNNPIPPLPEGASKRLQWLRWFIGITLGLFTLLNSYCIKKASDENARLSAELSRTAQETDKRLRERAQEMDERFRERSALLDEGRDRVSRYDLVARLLSGSFGSTDRDQLHVALAVNVARLALNPDEQATLFANLQTSPATRNVAKLGTQYLNDARKASECHENAGYLALASGDFGAAREQFRRAEALLPRSHWNYEIFRELESVSSNDSAFTRAATLRTIANRYLRYAPKDIAEKLRLKSAADDAGATEAFNPPPCAQEASALPQAMPTEIVLANKVVDSPKLESRIKALEDQVDKLQKIGRIVGDTTRGCSVLGHFQACWGTITATINQGSSLARDASDVFTLSFAQPPKVLIGTSSPAVSQAVAFVEYGGTKIDTAGFSLKLAPSFYSNYRHENPDSVVAGTNALVRYIAVGVALQP